ncbi:hypothetical protein B0T25DRAFT_571648 [Lasiosphaeria hispida]|uniref:Uncharacterized protein n=1 Tax=Lasiosphaeria hispida TaxID=260671 RepID=A0AAJ0HBY4_9PEZI|nr:hypothetical protein B0T25DRAFT_571648 [Lasiosphaeria hispida]
MQLSIKRTSEAGLLLPAPIALLPLPLLQALRLQPHGALVGQAEAQLHLWTPEIYENTNCPPTVTRECELRELRRYLRFDFEVEVRLREIGWGFWGTFKPSSQPPEIRAGNDSGKPLALDRMRFCVECCAERIRWICRLRWRRDIAKFGYVRRLQSTEEYRSAQNEPASTRFSTLQKSVIFA